jgi:hypothetical protein
MLKHIYAAKIIKNLSTFCQNVSFPNGTQFDNRRASSGLLRAYDSPALRAPPQEGEAQSSSNLKS